MTSRTNYRARARTAAYIQLRAAHPEEFAALRRQEAGADPAASRSIAYRRALRRLGAMFHAEYRALYTEYAPPLPRPERQQVRVLRRECDPTDAVILFDRGMTVKQIAEHDGCTQKAVLEVLVPILLKRRHPNAAWYDMSDQKLTVSNVAKALGTLQIAVQEAVSA